MKVNSKFQLFTQEICRKRLTRYLGGESCLKYLISGLCCLWLGFLLSACQGSNNPAATTTAATPDLVATQVAVQKAALATLTAEAPTAVAASPTVAATETSTQPTTPEISPTATPTTASTSPPLASPAATTTEAHCQVITSGLNLRPGPGTVFEPPLAALTNGAELTPLSFIAAGFPGGQWLEVQTIDGQRGWVSADPQLVNCDVPFTSLPTGVAPPTPTPAPVPTPTPLLFAVVPVDGADDNDFLQGRRVILPGFSPQQVTIPPVFRDKIVFAIEAYDIRFGTHDGAGIKQVEITITFNSPNEGDIQVHHQIEQQASFCAFGGGEPNCTVWDFAEHDYLWPEGFPILNGSYQVTFDITPQQGDVTQWRWSFEIAGAGTEPPPSNSSAVVAEIVQTGPGTTSSVVTDGLVFQVRAFHTGYGNNDGDGIDRVEFTLLNSQNQVIYQKTETNPAYCAFGGGEPDCNVSPLDPGDNGVYTLRATAYAVDGQSATVSMQIEVQAY